MSTKKSADAFDVEIPADILQIIDQAKSLLAAQASIEAVIKTKHEELVQAEAALAEAEGALERSYREFDLTKPDQVQAYTAHTQKEEGVIQSKRLTAQVARRVHEAFVAQARTTQSDLIAMTKVLDSAIRDLRQQLQVQLSAELERRLSPAFRLMYCAFALQPVIGFPVGGLQESALMEPGNVGRHIFHGAAERALIDGEWSSLRHDWHKDPTAAAVAAKMSGIKEVKAQLARLVSSLNPTQPWMQPASAVAGADTPSPTDRNSEAREQANNIEWRPRPTPAADLSGDDILGDLEHQSSDDLTKWQEDLARDRAGLFR